MTTEERRDWGVVLARGESRRMGRAKGLCRVAGDRRSMIENIVGLYASRGWPVAVVTTPELETGYAEHLAETTVQRWILASPGRGTAASVAAALGELGGEASHLWLHPVDLPGVTDDSLASLLGYSQRELDAVLVPEYQGTPGHPVVLPVAAMRGRIRADSPGSMRAELLAICGPGVDQVTLRQVAVGDQGVIRDYDTPEDLTAAHLGAGRAGEELNGEEQL